MYLNGFEDDDDVAQNLKRSEILNFMQRNYGEYRRSFTTLDRNHIDSVSTLGTEDSKCSPRHI